MYIYIYYAPKEKEKTEQPIFGRLCLNAAASRDNNHNNKEINKQQQKKYTYNDKLICVVRHTAFHIAYSAACVPQGHMLQGE